MSAVAKDLSNEIKRCMTIADKHDGTVGAYIIRANVQKAEKAMRDQNGIVMVSQLDKLKGYK